MTARCRSPSSGRAQEDIRQAALHKIVPCAARSLFGVHVPPLVCFFARRLKYAQTPLATVPAPLPSRGRSLRRQRKDIRAPGRAAFFAGAPLARPTRRQLALGQAGDRTQRTDAWLSRSVHDAFCDRHQFRETTVAPSRLVHTMSLTYCFQSAELLLSLIIIKSVTRHTGSKMTSASLRRLQARSVTGSWLGNQSMWQKRPNHKKNASIGTQPDNISCCGNLCATTRCELVVWDVYMPRLHLLRLDTRPLLCSFSTVLKVTLCI